MRLLIRTLSFAPIYVAVILFMFACSGSQSKYSILDTTVQVESGQLKGLINDEGTVVAFKGVPYAAPPVGDLRWKEPQPPLPWEGVRDASEFCASCIQNRAFSRDPWTEEFMVQDSISEDCLFLNIWTSAKSAEDNLPVLVYIHGGGLTEGSGSIDVYDGEELSKKGIIVITINYRLGALGFLAHPGLTAESSHNVSGNYGYLDQLAALKWIQKNITSFGGDPSRVTIAGQSAGAASVNALINSPLAAGLFHRSITQSGTSFSSGPMRARMMSDAERQGEEFARSKGASSIADLRDVPAMEIIARDTSQPRLGFFGGVIDGYFQISDRKTTFEESRQNDTPFMSGANADETHYRGSQGEEFKSLYPYATEEEKAAQLKVAGQEQSRLSTYLWMEFRAQTSNTESYQYFFDRAIPWPEAPEHGAFHTAEVPYMFNNMKMIISHTMERTDTIVADVMSSYYANFVKTGDPNGPGLPVWEPHSSGNHMVMRLGEKMGMMPITENEERFEFLKKQILEER